MKIQIVLTGRSYHRADAIPQSLELAEGATLREAVAAVDALLQADGGGGLPASCLITLQGRHLGRAADCPEERLADGDEVMLIAPVAGG